MSGYCHGKCKNAPESHEIWLAVAFRFVGRRGVCVFPLEFLVDEWNVSVEEGQKGTGTENS